MSCFGETLNVPLLLSATLALWTPSSLLAVLPQNLDLSNLSRQGKVPP